jgi:hypothetical protein
MGLHFPSPYVFLSQVHEGYRLNVLQDVDKNETEKLLMKRVNISIYASSLSFLLGFVYSTAYLNYAKR